MLLSCQATSLDVNGYTGPEFRPTGELHGSVFCIEYADQGIRINAVCPAIIETPMVERAFDGDEEMRNRFKAMHPVGRFGKPEEVASATLWLCSEGAAFTIGHALAVDGGRLI